VNGKGGTEAGRRLKAAVAGDYEGHLTQSHAAVAVGTADAQHRQHAGNSDGGKRGSCKGVAKSGKGAKGASVPSRGSTRPRPNQSRTRAPFVCSYRRENNKLSEEAICFDPNCKSARSCTAAKKFIARRDSGERAAKRARNERESRSFK
jgi:hypothetical protein